MISKYDVKYLNEYLGQYLRTLITQPDTEPLGILAEGAARFVAFIEEEIDNATNNNMD